MCCVIVLLSVYCNESVSNKIVDDWATVKFDDRAMPTLSYASAAIFKQL